MKKRFFLLILIMLMATALFASPFHFGVVGTFGTAIGTGKGNWDWTDPALGIQRSAPLNLGAAFMILTDLGPVFQLETGAGYYWNKCSISNGDEKWTYKQESLEFPLGLRLFFNGERRGLYAKGGTALILLTGKSSYKNDESGEELFDTQEAENKAHAGLQIGIGYQKEIRKILWELEAKYITFYSSPDYSRSDGSIADTRFHRMALNLGLFF
jgi:hypothetical protein